MTAVAWWWCLVAWGQVPPAGDPTVPPVVVSETAAVAETPAPEPDPASDLTAAATPAPATEPTPAPAQPPEPAAGPAPAPDPVPAPVPERETLVPPVVVLPAPGGPELVDPDVLPWVATRGFVPGLILLVVTLGFVALADGLGRLNQRLAARGVLPDLTRTGSAVARLLAAVFGLGWVAAWVPANVAPALPWIIVGGAIAVGWSARDLLQDGLAWLVIALEGRVRPGQWIRGPTFRGEVQAVGPRALLLRDERGGDLVVPNRLVLQDQYTRDPVEWPTVEVGVTLPLDLAPERARAALREAALLAPWIAPGEVQVAADPEVAGRWVVRARLLEGTWLAAFEGSLRERVDEVLRTERG